MPYKDPDVQREYMRVWMAQRRAAFFAGKVCARCHTDTGLEVSYRDLNLKITHRFWSWSAARREQELAKCDILCRPCRGQRNGDQRRARDPVQHGTERAYNRGCHCQDCRTAHAVANIERKRQRRTVLLLARVLGDEEV